VIAVRFSSAQADLERATLCWSWKIHPEFFAISRTKLTNKPPHLIVSVRVTLFLLWEFAPILLVSAEKQFAAASANCGSAL
jgi:hypothetical protein